MRAARALGDTPRQPDVHVAIAVLSSDESPARRRRREGPRAHAELPGVELHLASGLLPARDGADVVRLQGRHRSTRCRGQRPTVRRTLASGRSRPARSSWATPTRRESCHPCRPRTCWVATAPTSCSGSCTPGSLPTGATCAREAANRAEEDLLGAKIVGRWQSGAPLALSPDQDDPELGSDPARNNDFGFGDDPRGFKCPVGAHARRANPRDALDQEGSVDVRLHRMIRRGTSYGPMLPDGVSSRTTGSTAGSSSSSPAPTSNGSSSSSRPSGSTTASSSAPRSSPTRSSDRTTTPASFTIPQRPIRRRLQDLPPFVVTRGGEYCFAPSLSALRWLAELDT